MSSRYMGARDPAVLGERGCFEFSDGRLLGINVEVGVGRACCSLTFGYRWKQSTGGSVAGLYVDDVFVCPWRGRSPLVVSGAVQGSLVSDQDGKATSFPVESGFGCDPPAAVEGTTTPTQQLRAMRPTPTSGRKCFDMSRQATWQLCQI